MRVGDRHRSFAACVGFRRVNTGLNPAGPGPLHGRSLDLRHGDLFAPVAGETFDLVVSNLPFVITPPPTRRTCPLSVSGWAPYRRRNRCSVRTRSCAFLTARRFRAVAGKLGNPGGEDWRDRVGGWLTESGLHGWVVRELQDPAEYAEIWIRDGGQRPRFAYDAMYSAWLDDFAARGVEAVASG